MQSVYGSLRFEKSLNQTFAFLTIFRPRLHQYVYVSFMAVIIPRKIYQAQEDFGSAETTLVSEMQHLYLL